MGGELGPWEGILSTRFYYAEFQGTEHQLKGPGLFDFGVWKKPRVSVATDTRIAETYHHNQRNQISHVHGQPETFSQRFRGRNLYEDTRVAHLPTTAEFVI